MCMFLRYTYLYQPYVEMGSKMFKDYVKDANVLSYMDADVTADWRKGMLKSVADLVCSYGVAEGIKFGSWGAILGFTEGSLAEHFYADGPRKMHYQGVGHCKIVSVTHLSEEKTEEYTYNSFNGGTAHTESGVRGEVTCEHGVTGVMFYTVSVGELIYAIASKQ